MKSVFEDVPISAIESLPSWECGLKYWKRSKRHRCNRVTPFVGVWIEITTVLVVTLLTQVTPFVGVWIEITNMPYIIEIDGSHSLRGSVD